MPQEEIATVTPNQWDERMLLRADSMSPEEISVYLGGVIRPKTVAARITELLKTKNWLTLMQQRQLLDWKLRRILGTLEGRFLDLDNAMMQLRLIREINKQLDKREASTTVDLEKLYGNQGRIMAQAFDIALSYMKGALRSQVDAAEWDSLQVEALAHARAELDKHTAIEE